MAESLPGRAREHRLGRFAPRDQHGPSRRSAVWVSASSRSYASARAPPGVGRLVVEGFSAVHRRAGGGLLKQVVERLALAVIERAEHLVLDR